jgi:hypothetical protein
VTGSEMKSCDASLNEHEETFGEARARSTDPAEEERLRRIKGEIEYEQGFFTKHGLLGASITIVLLLLLIWLASHTDLRLLYAFGS